MHVALPLFAVQQHKIVKALVERFIMTTIQAIALMSNLVLNQ